MISSLECLIRLLDEQDQKAIDADTIGGGGTAGLFEEREIVERELLLAPIASDADAVAKVRYLARVVGEGERSDGLDVSAMAGLAVWMERRFQVTQHSEEAVAA